MSPRPAEKLCSTTMQFTFADDGSIAALTDVIMSAGPPDPLLIMSLTYVVTVQGEAVCLAAPETSIDAATFTVAGQPATPVQTDMIRSQIKSAMSGAAENCFVFAEHGGATVFKPAEGEVPAELLEPVVWLERDAGYAVGY